MKVEFLLAGLGVRVAGLIFQMFEVGEEVSIEMLLRELLYGLRLCDLRRGRCGNPIRSLVSDLIRGLSVCYQTRCAAAEQGEQNRKILILRHRHRSFSDLLVHKGKPLLCMPSS